MKITKKQLRQIIKEARSAEEEFENAGMRGREMAKTKHQFDRAFRQMRAFEAAPSDLADMEEIRDLYFQDLPKGEASNYLKRLVSGVDTIIREQIPQDVYYWIFPELLESVRGRMKEQAPPGIFSEDYVYDTFADDIIDFLQSERGTLNFLTEREVAMFRRAVLGALDKLIEDYGKVR